jgi:Zn-finger nucleic acid-binding protein
VRAFDEGADEAALRAIREKYIWDDEGVAVGTPPKRLTPRALRLLGDVAVLLNLNEAGARTFTDKDVARDRELREQFATNNYLPWCLSLGHNRDALLDPQGQCGCPFERCPYPRNVQRAHRELSKLFCRDARGQALAFSRPPWQSKLRGSTYWRFWMEMERKAKHGA